MNEALRRAKETPVWIAGGVVAAVNIFVLLGHGHWLGKLLFCGAWAAIGLGNFARERGHARVAILFVSDAGQRVRPLMLVALVAAIVGAFVL